jgi:D-aminopeptidase
MAVATGRRAPRRTAPTGPEPLIGRDLDPFFEAVVDATEEAVLNSLFAAPTVVGRDGNYSRGLPADRVAEFLSAAGRI